MYHTSSVLFEHTLAIKKIFEEMMPRVCEILLPYTKSHCLLTVESILTCSIKSHTSTKNGTVNGILVNRRHFGSGHSEVIWGQRQGEL